VRTFIHDLPLILCYELNSVHVNLLISKGYGFICFVIIVISSVFEIILQHLWSFCFARIFQFAMTHFWYIQTFIINLDNMPLIDYSLGPKCHSQVLQKNFYSRVLYLRFFSNKQFTGLQRVIFTIKPS
jgi:hypothetical protein